MTTQPPTDFQFPPAARADMGQQTAWLVAHVPSTNLVGVRIQHGLGEFLCAVDANTALTLARNFEQAAKAANRALVVAQGHEALAKAIPGADGAVDLGQLK